MVWIRKADAPTSFSLAQAFAADITGDLTWSWLAQFIPLIPPAQYDTDAFCSAGPYPASPLTAADFLSALGSNPYGGIFVGGSIVGQNVSAAAMNRMFGAYCINRTGGDPDEPTTCNVVGTFAKNDADGIVDQFPVPDGTFRVGVRNLGPSVGRIDIYGYNSAHGYTGQLAALGEDVAAPWSAFQYVDWSDAIAFMTINGHGGAQSIEICIWPTVNTPTDTPFTPTAQPQPDGVLLPTPGDYPDIAALGRELDAIELKLEYVMSVLSSVADQTPVPVGAAGPPEDIVDDAPIDITGAAGMVVTITTLPPSADEEFGSPPIFHRLGNVIFAGPDGFGPVIPVQTTPLVILPMPPTRTTASLRMKPGTVGHIRLIPKAIPLGQRTP